MESITRDKHRHKTWCQYKNFSFAAGFSFSPIVSVEIPRSVMAMPLAFVREESGYRLAAVFSPGPGINLFVAPNGRWAGDYVPAAVRSYPFSLEIDAEGLETLYADESSGLIVSDQSVGVTIFDEAGEWSEPMQRVIKFLRQMEENRKITVQAVSMLAEADILTEWLFKVKMTGEEKTATGFYRIDEQHLVELPDVDFLKLRHSGALKIAYAQLFSMGNIAKLANLARMREKMAQKKQEKQFALADDGIFRFE
jgi:hypothetical protein